ncbi:Ig-like domain-containing protein [Segatella maculosa]|uniref:Ig-like domain-containing protein n=1 Tax=Segatella maculosa TaxID=439703 RepID=UPI0024908CB5|nr:Ig-like domain-containing protein [Segatella maculosa]
MIQAKRISIWLIALAGLMTVTNAAQAKDYTFEYKGMYYQIFGQYASVVYGVKVVPEKKTPPYYSAGKKPKGSVTISGDFTTQKRRYIVAQIGENLFSGCDGITSVTIPIEVQKIGDRAFQGCKGLQTVTVHWKTPLDVPNSVFDGVNTANVMLKVPKGKEEAYKAHPVWGKFKFEGSTPPPPPAPPTILVTSVTLDQMALNLNNVATYKLNATVLPNNATNPALSWTSTDNSIATVDATGLVTVRSKGSVVITASTTDGSAISVSCTAQIHSVVANEAIEALRIYAADGALHLALPSPETVYIYGISGAMVKTLTLPAGNHVQPLPAGVYVVRVGETVEKILVK